MEFAEEDGWRQRAVRSYLQGFGISEPDEIARLTPRLLDRESESAPDLAGFIAAMDRRVVAWLGTVLADDNADPARFVTRVRAAVLLSDAAMRWPGAFLGENPPPVAMVGALRAAMPVATPAERPLEMAAQHLPLPSIARAVPRLRRLAPAGTSRSER